MSEKNPRTCWEYWQCDKKTRVKCPAYKTQSPCWHVAGQYCGRVNKRGIQKCFLCGWFKLKHSERMRNSEFK
ncbi:MAG: hypothetical protein COV72_03590 [Candidatus Omnitrophica bacterium CG11_big_fil_rev_8_21_14_0_20_42_13]|uniref:Uncharacterized protein n=1 Tax=Candidatus Ghiorseimicrobium undicola TaxID=1974746 RepID=A0A2H0LY43_9BACT|nr:MAG: hypothetical protein COV72_03590 [Candidatus Omnitrophica bacterium CG11_big_fil_rev_8_21_14_0_20_42_13]